MHSYLTTKAARRLLNPVLPATICVLNMSLPTGSVTSLRQVVMRVCGEQLQFMRIDTCMRTNQTRVFLCLGRSVLDAAVEALTRYFPDARFGSLSETALPHLVRPRLQ
ncbi:hypothetical protein AAKU55_003227 [Oxalobacteraceae bacterium GrIS 1.11]